MPASRMTAPARQNQGFDIDNLTTSVYNNTDGTGNDGDNVITGNSGDNILTGGAGNDTIDGGAGSDTAVFSGLRSQYLVTVNPNSSLHIVDLRGGSPDGTDDVSNVEFLQFADGTVLAGVNHAPVVNGPGPDRGGDGRPDVPGVQSVQRHRRGQQYAGVRVLRRHCGRRPFRSQWCDAGGRSDLRRECGAAGADDVRARCGRLG